MNFLAWIQFVAYQLVWNKLCDFRRIKKVNTRWYVSGIQRAWGSTDVFSGSLEILWPVNTHRIMRCVWNKRSRSHRATPQNNEAPQFPQKLGSRHELTWTWSVRRNKKWHSNTVSSNWGWSAPKEFGDKIGLVKKHTNWYLFLCFEKNPLSIKRKKGSFSHRIT